MADNGSSQAPDLQSILATLASYTPSSQLPVSTTYSSASYDQSKDQSAQPMPPPQQPKPEDPRLRPQGRSTASPKPAIDPASITTWPDGLRCVTKIAAQNAQFAVSIRKMMDNQRQNEMRWYAERQALKQSQSSRERAAAQASELLKGFNNGTSADTTNGGDGVDLEKELATFDRKIYSAQLQMDAAMTAELKDLGVPFFGTDVTAVVDANDTQDVNQPLSSRPKHSPLITEKQLMELRRRMVEHLEALYRD